MTAGLVGLILNQSAIPEEDIRASWECSERAADAKNRHKSPKIESDLDCGPLANNGHIADSLQMVPVGRNRTYSFSVSTINVNVGRCECWETIEAGWELPKAAIGCLTLGQIYRLWSRVTAYSAPVFGEQQPCTQRS